MKVLLLAPQPCYVDRGTPIAVDMTLATLSDAGYEVDLLTFPGGADRHYPGLRIFRVGEWLSRRPVQAGFSAKKLVLDVLMFFKALQMVVLNRYTLVHAVEESSFIAMLLRLFFRLPYIIDMDSRMTTQLTDRYPWLGSFDKLLWAIETLPSRFASSVVTMCDSLRVEVLKVRDNRVFVVKDVSLLDYYGDPALEPPQALEDIRAKHDQLLMYIGNLETYQGISLMLQAFALQQTDAKAAAKSANAALVVVGGDAHRIELFRERAKVLGLEDHCYFIGPQPVGLLVKLMRQADVMLSPRTQGTNTPLKLYSYLDSGVPVIATNLQTHTQVVNEDQALLCEPNPQDMASAMSELLQSAELRTRIATNAKKLIDEHHSLAGFRAQMLEIYRVVTHAGGLSEQSEAA